MSMNLHALVRGVISTVNEDQKVIVLINKGSQHLYGGITQPLWKKIRTTAQVQPVSSDEIKFIDNYVESSTYRTFYLNGDFNGLNRRVGSGGDKIYWNGHYWYVASNPEPWEIAGWTCVHCVQQLDDEEEEYIDDDDCCCDECCCANK